jgi:hypothetical protein
VIYKERVARFGFAKLGEVAEHVDRRGELRSSGMHQTDRSVVENEAPSSQRDVVSSSEGLQPLDLGSGGFVIAPQPNLPPGERIFSRQLRLIVGPKRSKRSHTNRLDSVDQLSVFRLSFASVLVGVLLKSVQKVRNFPFRNEHGRGLDVRLVLRLAGPMDAADLNARVLVLQRLQL